MQPRRAQQPISFRSDKAAAKLAVLTRGGRSQAEVIEDALDTIPDPDFLLEFDFSPVAIAERRARLDTILAEIEPGSVMAMAEFDAQEYDEHGLPR